MYKNRKNHWIGIFHISILCFGLWVTPTIEADDWPEFLGNDKNGSSKERGLLSQWPQTGPPAIWDISIGSGYGAPSVKKGLLVFHHRRSNQEIVECLDAISGKTIWKQGYPSRFIDPFGYSNGPRCSPILTDKLCYTFGAEGVLSCLQLKDGSLVWQKKTRADWTIPNPFFGVGSTPLLRGGKLLVMMGGQPNSGVVALDPKTGTTIWESVGKQNWQGQPMTGWRGSRTVAWQNQWKQASFSSLITAEIHGKPHLIALMRQGLVSLDPDSGKVNFSRWFRATVNDSVNGSTPVIVDNYIFISNAYYNTGSALLKVNPSGAGFEEIWASRSLETHWNTPIYHKGYLYAFTGRQEEQGALRCVQFRTGKLMWETTGQKQESTSDVQRTRRGFLQREDRFGRGSCLKVDGKLILLGERGLLAMAELNPKQYVELSRYRHPSLKHPCWAAPIISNRRLFIRSEGQLVCLNLASGSN
ncbi:MAG TPA: hypothetical protein EYQ50_02695 [Verrucomicrobiales bacterium]|nr:hypothetical protein [Verrucomicrobiales bacterium]